MLLLWWNPFNLNTITNTNQDAVPSRPAAQRAPIHTIAIGSMIPSNSVLRALEETKTTLKSIVSVLYQQVRGEIKGRRGGAIFGCARVGPTGRYRYY
jgi:hypothetical protein